MIAELSCSSDANAYANFHILISHSWYRYKRAYSPAMSNVCNVIDDSYPFAISFC